MSIIPTKGVSKLGIRTKQQISRLDCKCLAIVRVGLMSLESVQCHDLVSTSVQNDMSRFLTQK